MRSREKRNLVSSKDEKNQHRVRVLLEGECIRKNANEVQDWGDLLLSCDFEDALGVVNLNFTETLEDTLTEQERSILTLHY